MQGSQARKGGATDFRSLAGIRTMAARRGNAGLKAECGGF